MKNIKNLSWNMKYLNKLLYQKTIYKKLNKMNNIKNLIKIMKLKIIR